MSSPTGSEDGLPDDDAVRRFEEAFRIPKPANVAQREHRQVLAAGQCIDGYEIGSCIGIGGMGRVYKARQISTDRTVALKVVSSLSRDTDDVRRFSDEIHTLADLRHPDIVAIHGAGRIDDFTPYLALEYVEGTHFTDYVQNQKIGDEEVRLLLAHLCDVVQVVHTKGYIHRDIKPSNVLVTPDGRLKLLDFGVARKLQRDVKLTLTGRWMGTPFYMSPEQTRNEEDVRSDIYSIGVLAFEAFTKRLPWNFPADAADAIAIIRDEKNEPLKLRSVHAELSQELEWVISKAIERDPSRRYEHASEMAKDLRAVETGNPLVAGPQTRLYRLRKFYRRHRKELLPTALAAALLLFFVLFRFERGGKLEAQTRERRARELSARQLADLRVDKGMDALELDDPALALLWFTTALEGEPDEVRRQEHRLRCSDAIMRISALPSVEPAPVDSADNDLVVVNDPDRRTHHVRIRSAGTTNPPLVHPAWINSAQQSNDRRRVVTAGRDRMVRVWDATTGRTIMSVAHEAPAETVTFDPAGDRVISGGWDKKLCIWQVPSGVAQFTHDFGEFVSSVCVDPTGRWIAAGGNLGRVSVFEAATGQPVSAALRHNATVRHLRFSIDGRLLVIGSDDGLVRVWSWQDGDTQALLRHPAPVKSIAFERGQAVLVTGCEDGLRRAWPWQTSIAEPVLIRQNVQNAAFSTSGRQLAMISSDGLVTQWDLLQKADGASFLANPDARVERLSDDQRVLLRTAPRMLRLWTPNSGFGPSIDVEGDCYLDLAPDFERIVRVDRNHTAFVQQLTDGRVLLPEIRKSEDLQANFVDDNVLAVCGWGFVALYDAKTGKQRSDDLPHSSRVAEALRLGNDVASRGWDGVVYRWVLNPPNPPNSISQFPHGAAIYHLAISRDQSLIAMAGEDCKARIWDAVTAKPVSPPIKLPSLPRGLMFSTDNQRVIMAHSESRSWRIWNRQGRPLTGWIGQGTEMCCASPDGVSFFEVSSDGVGRCWRLEPDSRSVEELQCLAELLASSHLDATGAPMPLTKEQWNQRWRRLNELRR